MNVTLKPLNWNLDLHGTVGCDTPFFSLFIYQVGDKWAWAASRGGHHSGIHLYTSGVDASHAATKWYVGKVLDCLELADRDAVDQFAKLREGT